MDRVSKHISSESEPEHAWKKGRDDASEEKIASATGVKGNGTETGEHNWGNGNGVDQDWWVDISNVVHGWAYEESKEEGESPHISHSHLFSFTWAGNLACKVHHCSNGENCCHKSLKNSVCIEVHSKGTNCGAEHDVTVHFWEMALCFWWNILKLEKSFHFINSRLVAAEVFHSDLIFFLSNLN